MENNAQALPMSPELIGNLEHEMSQDIQPRIRPAIARRDAWLPLQGGITRYGLV